MIRILLVDPDPVRRRRLHQALAGDGLSVTEASNAREVAAVDLGRIDAAVSNTDLPVGRGIELRENLGAIPLILYAEHDSVRCAVEAMQQGAADYLVIPFEPTELVAAIRRCLRSSPLSGIGRRAPNPLTRIVGTCSAMRNLLERIDVVAQRECGALIQGEAGVGKELVARAVHAAGPRRQMPLISLNCATIPPGLIEAELFGVEGAAYPVAENLRVGLIEAAQLGTLCLDEIGELSLQGQARLMGVLHERKFRRVGTTEPRPIDVVLIATTHRDLSPLVAAGQFRADLYERLRTTMLWVPPLRERGEDIVELTHWLLQRTCLKLSRPELVLSDAAMAAIRSYEWPGNVRELENALERAVILCNTTVIEPGLLAIAATRPAPRAQPRVKGNEADEVNVETSLEGYFVKFVLEHQDSLTETELAHKLGISRKSLWERRQRLNIPRKRTRNRGSRRDVGA